MYHLYYCKISFKFFLVSEMNEKYLEIYSNNYSEYIRAKIS